jgi:hypothetical protein
LKKEAKTFAPLSRSSRRLREGGESFLVLFFKKEHLIFSHATPRGLTRF